MKGVVGITGASGVIYGVRLVEELLKRGIDTYVLISDKGEEILELEVKGWRERIKGAKLENDLPLSGSFKFDFMAVVPCTLNTLGKLAYGICDTSVTRAGIVAMKERRKLLLLVREMPWPPQAYLSAYLLSSYGAVVMPASPAFYFRPSGIEDIINFVVGRILDALGLENDLYRRWGNDREFSEEPSYSEGRHIRRL